jgi:hypothetical protein
MVKVVIQPFSFSPPKTDSTLTYLILLISTSCVVYVNKMIIKYFAVRTVPGADPRFQVRGGPLKKIAPSGGRREHFWGISCEKSRFYAKKSYFFQLSREARKFWGISCEKSRFYAKK